MLILYFFKLLRIRILLFRFVNLFKILVFFKFFKLIFNEDFKRIFIIELVN